MGLSTTRPDKAGSSRVSNPVRREPSVTVKEFPRLIWTADGVGVKAPWGHAPLRGGPFVETFGMISENSSPIGQAR